MAGIFPWRRWLDGWRKPPMPIKQEPGASTPDAQAAASAAHPTALTGLDTALLDQSCLALQREASLVQAEWKKNRLDQDSQLQAYIAAQGNDGQQRGIAEERVFTKKLGRDLEARYHAIQKHAQLLNGIALLARKQQWAKQHLSLDTLAGLDLPALQAHLSLAVAQSEADDTMLADMLNLLDAAAEKEARRRDIAVQDELAELAQLAGATERGRATTPGDTLPRLEVISDELQELLNRSLNGQALAPEKSPS